MLTTDLENWVLSFCRQVTLSTPAFVNTELDLTSLAHMTPATNVKTYIHYPVEHCPNIMIACLIHQANELYFLYFIAPPIFLPVFELIRPFLSEPSRKATKLFDYDSEKWKKALLKEIPADQLPTLYGGNRTVTAQTLAQLKKSNPYVKAAFEKATKNKTS